ncbi:PHB depolymerase family esterase [Bradyrhizobium sp.]|uniref:alpha/beta hydrolase family esterase n=1 Tax=Bradyrhizobium sp. TaxID=376 RepID=UPI001E19F887|nr:PHB depolymerase family esterase [Bradyrhizobium sp.]MBI5320302.1 prolyl oligopeptidase family serine peptidase [Bradyrhizobium sp.]
MIRFLVLLLVLTGANSAAAETIAIGKVTRHYTARLPDTKSAPLVIVLHGNTQTGADMITRTGWPAVAKREGFGVVFPDGLNHSWADLRPNNLRAGRVPPHGTDDVAFIAKLVEKFVAEGSADPKRVYITGISNGGAMTMTLVCKRADLFAAAASVVINLTDPSANPCRPSRPMPMLMMNGTADPLVPYKGGRGTSRFAVDGFWSVEKTLGFWRRNNGCEAKDAAVTDLEDSDRGDRSSVTRIDSNCPAGRDVVLYRVNDGGHRMPGSPDARFPRLANTFLGPQNRDIDGAETIWAFFKKFP